MEVCAGNCSSAALKRNSIGTGSGLQRVVDTTEIIKTDVKHPSILIYCFFSGYKKYLELRIKNGVLSLDHTKHNPFYGPTQYRTPGFDKGRL
jgi:hypothetical protein